MSTNRRRKRFNRVAKLLSEIYNKEYIFVLKIYYKMECNIQRTKEILSLITND